MIDTIVEIQAIVWTEENPQPSQSVLMAEYLDKQAYLTTTPDEFTGIILGAWDSETGLQEGQTYNDLGDIVGTPTHPIQPNYLTYVRPLGNEDGIATGVLDSMRFQGHVEPKYVEEDKRYPSTNAPFSLRIERQLILDDGFPHIPNGWKVTMISDDPERDITARAIGIYDSNGNYLYTTGAFVPDGLTYSTVCPVGQRTADEQQINFKLLLGSAPEGAWTLPVGKEDDTRQFWEGDQ